MKIWYARVSTVGQCLDIQLEKLSRYGCERIFEDKRSGDDSLGGHAAKRWRDERGALAQAQALSFIRESELLVITRLLPQACSVLGLSQITAEVASKKVNRVRPRLSHGDGWGDCGAHHEAVVVGLLNLMWPKSLVYRSTSGQDWPRRPNPLAYL
jgi:Resolvase, N terminal domain